MSENLIDFYENGMTEDYDRIGFGAQRLPEGFVVFRQPYPDLNYFWCTETRESVRFCNHWMAFRSAWGYYRKLKEIQNLTSIQDFHRMGYVEVSFGILKLPPGYVAFKCPYSDFEYFWVHRNGDKRIEIDGKLQVVRDAWSDYRKKHGYEKIKCDYRKCENYACRESMDSHPGSPGHQLCQQHWDELNRLCRSGSEEDLCEFDKMVGGENDRNNEF